MKYVFSGDVHTPIKASFKTAVSYKGIKFINLPATSYRSRSFGEEDYFGGPSQEVTIADVKGEIIRMTYKTVTEEEFEYPDNLPEFDNKKYGLWLKHKWELPVNKIFINGNFEQGLSHWIKRFVYTEDENPSNICEVRKNVHSGNNHTLYLYTRKRIYSTPGKDRWPQDINRICQAVMCNLHKKPFIEFDYMLDGKNCDLNGLCGAYIWIEGYQGSLKKVNLMYSANKIWYNIGGNYNYIRLAPPVQFALNDTPDKWHKVTLNIAVISIVPQKI